MLRLEPVHSACRAALDLVMPRTEARAAALALCLWVASAAPAGAGVQTTGETAAAGQSGGDRASDERPNIVFIFTDDQDQNQFSYFGYDALTPHIDSLAKDGAYFSRFYVASAVCTPSRFNVLTGRYASRSRAVLEEFPPPGPSCLTWNANLQPGERTIAHRLQEAGYVTGMVGKWMCGYPPDLREVPLDASASDPEVLATLRQNYDTTCAWIRDQFGFDYAASVYKSNLPGIGLPLELHHHNMEWITQGALEFIEANAERPFFLYLATTLPHVPVGSLDADPRITPVGMLEEAPSVQPSRRSVHARVRAAGLDPDRAKYTWVDDAVGAVLEKLDELDLANNTLVAFAPDHATRGKYTCYEGARVPLFVRWPGRIRRGTVIDALTSNIDLAPTFLALAQGAAEQGAFDGRTLEPCFAGKPPAAWRDSLLLEITYTKAVVTRDWKYIALRYPEDVQAAVDAGDRRAFAQDGSQRLRKTHKRFPGYFDYDQLYNLARDPLEQRNVAANPNQRKRLAAMRALLSKHLAGSPSAFGEFHDPSASASDD